MATGPEYQSLRDDLDVSRKFFPDPSAKRVFDDAEAQYTTVRTIYAGARVIAIRRLLMKAAKLTKYTQNNSQEDPTTIAKALEKLLDIWLAALEQAKKDDEAEENEVIQGQSVVRFGKTAIKPARTLEMPYERFNYR
jgi:hypothetical protein